MSSGSFQSALQVPNLCNCGIPVARKQSWTNRNPGRRFVTCKFYNPASNIFGCGTFAWVDERQEEWQRLLINSLILEKKLMERKVDQLKLQVCTLDDEKAKLVKDNRGLKLKLKKMCGKTTNVNWIVIVVVVLFVISMFVGFAISL